MTFDVAASRQNSPSMLVPLMGIVLAGGVLAGIAYGVSVYAAAIPYALGFLALVYVRPDLAFALILASAPFCYDLGIGPVKVALSDISLILAIPVLLLKAKNPFGRFLRTPVLPAVAAYFLICIISVLASGDIANAIASMVQMGLYLLVTLFVFSSCIDDRQIFYSGLHGLLVSCFILATVKLCSTSLYILGLHKNSIGSSLSYGVLIAAELWIAARGRRRRILGFVLVVLLAGLVSSLSRGAWLGATGGVMLILLMRREFRLVRKISVLAFPILFICWFLLPDQAKDYASDLRFDAHNVQARFVSIQFAYSFFEHNPVLGAGVGLRKEYDATNLIMSTLAETGVLGLLAFLGIYASAGVAVWRGRAQIAASHPLFPLFAIGAALALCQFLHGLVDHFWSRGCLPAWAGLGTVLYVYRSIMPRRLS